MTSPSVEKNVLKSSLEDGPEDEPQISRPSASEDLVSAERPGRIRIKNRRKRYLDMHPEYFSSDLELADPLLYDRLIRRFQTASERELDGRKKGYSGTLEADLLRSEAKLDALAHPDPNMPLAYRRGQNGEIIAEEVGEIPLDKQDALNRWQKEMQLRFLRGDDHDMDYSTIDNNEEFDDHVEEERARQDEYFATEEPSNNWVDSHGEQSGTLTGETGVQDF